MDGMHPDIVAPPIYTGCPRPRKKMAHFCTPYNFVKQISTNFRTLFTVRIARKLVIVLSLDPTAPQIRFHIEYLIPSDNVILYLIDTLI